MEGILQTNLNGKFWRCSVLQFSFMAEGFFEQIFYIEYTGRTNPH